MVMKKKVLSMLMGVSILAAALAGCGKAPASTENSAPAPAATDSAQAAETPEAAESAAGTQASGEKKTVQFWHCMSGTNGDLINQMVSDFNSSQNEVEVVATFQGSYAEAAAKAEQAIFAGNAPDILQVAQDNVGRLAVNGAFADLLPHMQKDGMDDKDFVDAFVNDAYYEGKLVVIPFGRSAQILHINKTVLDEMGCEIPTTWDELKEVANKCTIVENGETKRYGLSVPFDQWEFFALIQQAGGKFFNEDQTGLGCLDDGTAKEAFSFMKDLQDSGALYYNDPANDQDNQMFTSGMAAMTINSSGAITSRRETIGDSFEYVVAPLVKGKIESMPTGGNGFGIQAASKEQDAAWKFMKWFIEDEKGGLAFVIGSGYLPFTKTMAQSDAIQNLWKESDNYKIAYDALQYGDDSYRIANLTPVIAEFRTCIQAIMLDNQDIDQSLKTFSDSVDIILND